MTQPSTETFSERFQRVAVRPRHRMIDRMSEILECVARNRGGITLTEIAKNVGAPVSSTQGLVNGLTAQGYLEEHNLRYTLGTAPYLLNVLAGRPPVAHVTHEQLEALHEETQLTTAIAAPVGGNLFYIDHVGADANFAYLAEKRLRRSLIHTSSGWLLLAAKDRRDLWSHLSELPESDAPYIEQFLHQLDELRATGVCVAPNVAQYDGDGVSVALRENGRTIATIAVIGPEDEIARRKNEVLTACVEHAQAWGLR